MQERKKRQRLTCYFCNVRRGRKEAPDTQPKEKRRHQYRRTSWLEPQAETPPPSHGPKTNGGRATSTTNTQRRRRVTSWQQQDSLTLHHSSPRPFGTSSFVNGGRVLRRVGSTSRAKEFPRAVSKGRHSFPPTFARRYRSNGVV